MSNHNMFGGMTLKALLENNNLQHAPAVLQEAPSFKAKKASNGATEADFTSAFLGPQLWDKTYNTGDFNLEYMDLDEFLCENLGDLPVGENQGLDKLITSASSSSPHQSSLPQNSPSPHVSPRPHLSPNQHMSHRPQNLHVSQNLLVGQSPHGSPSAPVGHRSHVSPNPHVSQSSHISSSPHISQSQHVGSSPPHISHRQHLGQSPHVSPNPHISSNSHVGHSPHVSPNPHISPNSHVGHSPHVSPNPHSSPPHSPHTASFGAASTTMHSMVVPPARGVNSSNFLLKPKVETTEDAAQKEGNARSPSSPGSSSSRSTPPVSPLPVHVDFSLTEQDLALSSIPGQSMFDPTLQTFTEDDLKPQPMIKKSRKVFVPEDLKDDKYWARRKKNNQAAKRSRDARRVKENQIAMRAAYLEKENNTLRDEMEKIRHENARLKHRLNKYEPSA